MICHLTHFCLAHFVIFAVMLAPNAIRRLKYSPNHNTPMFGTLLSRFRMFSTSKVGSISNAVVIQPTQLESLISATVHEKKKFVLVDCSPLASSDQVVCIPGSVSLQEAVESQNMMVTLKGDDRIRICSREKFECILTELGIDASTQVVVYDRLQSQMASRFLWASALFGLPRGRVQLLDGGLKHWSAHRMNLTDEYEDPVPATPNSDASWSALQANPGVLATADQIMAKCVKSNTAEFTLFDSRSPEEYSGIKNINQRAGHIPGAKQLDWTSLLNPQTNAFKPNEEMRALLQRAGIISSSNESEKPIITYCQSGARAAVAWVALRHLGYNSAAMYDASMSEWANRTDTPLNK